MKKVILSPLIFIILFTGNTYSQWVQTMAGIDSVAIYCLADNSSTIFGGAYTEGVFYSRNNGTSWTQYLYNGYLYYSTVAIAANGNNIFAVAVPSNVFGSVWRSTNNGINWEGTTLNDISDLSSLAVQGGYIIAGAYGGVYRSSDNGTTWTNTNIPNSFIYNLTVDGIYLYAGTNHGVYASHSYGASWFSIGLDSCVVYSVAAEGSNIFAGIESPYFQPGVFRTTNYGINWTPTSLPDGSGSIVVSGNNVIAAVWNHGIMLSKDNGVNWTEKNEGFPGNPSVYDFLLRGNYIFASTLNFPGTGSVWRRELSEIIGLQNIGTEIPGKYHLSQNYPNPFNPSTTLRFSIPGPSSVNIIVYDISGKEIMTLVNSQLQAGTYQTDWNASAYPSGVYFCRMKAKEQNTNKTGITKEYLETIKLSLLK